MAGRLDCWLIRLSGTIGIWLVYRMGSNYLYPYGGDGDRQTTLTCHFFNNCLYFIGIDVSVVWCQPFAAVLTRGISTSICSQTLICDVRITLIEDCNHTGTLT